jgi:hypothetical protein
LDLIGLEKTDGLVDCNQQESPAAPGWSCTLWRLAPMEPRPRAPSVRRNVLSYWVISPVKKSPVSDFFVL